MEKEPSRSEQKFMVIGVGLPRTGTTSLQCALEIILPGKCHHMVEAMRFHQEEWRDIYNGKMSDDEFRNFLQSNYAAAVDAPFCFQFERAMKLFPDAKVILSIREPDGWAKSLKATVHDDFEFAFPYTIFGTLGLFSSYIGKMPSILINSFGKSDVYLELKREVREGRGIEYFNNWTRKVEEIVPVEKLLKFNVKDGWEPLCKFMDVPQPDLPFPRINSRADFEGRLSKRTRRSWLLLYEIVTIPVLAYLCYKMN